MTVWFRIRTTVMVRFRIWVRVMVRIRIQALVLVKNTVFEAKDVNEGSG